MLMNWRLNFKLTGITMWIGLHRRTLSRLICTLLFKVTQKVPSFPFMSIFTSVGNDFVRTQENVHTQEGSSVPSIWLELSQYYWLYAVSGLQCQGLQWWTYNGSYLLMKVGHEPNFQGFRCVWNHTQCVKCQSIRCLAWNTSWHVSCTLQPCRYVNLL